MLNKGALVLECVTLGGVVQLVVEVLVDLSGGTVLDQKAAENTLTAHPHDLPIIQHVSLDLIRTIDGSLNVARNIPSILSSCNHVGTMARNSLTTPCFYPLYHLTSTSNRDGVHVLRHTGIGSTLPLSEATVATDPAGEVQLTSTGTRVHGDWLADDEAIGDELADGLAGVGVGDLVDLVGVEPDLALAAAEDISCEALLSSQVDPI